MPLLVRNLVLGLDESEDALVGKAAKVLDIPPDAVESMNPARRSIDARDRDQIQFVYHVELTLRDGDRAERVALRRGRPGQVVLVRRPDEPPPAPGDEPLEHRPLIVGFGPAGMFAALELAEAGYKPLVIERGRDVSRRHYDVLKRYYRDGQFHESSNLLFGEGGAGTYSDGKLYTRVSDRLVRRVLEVFCEHGADPDIMTDARPHVGSEKLPGICRRMRKHIERLGGEIQFDSALYDVHIDGGVLQSVRINRNWRDVGPVLLAVGHSARDTLRLLANRGVALEAKPFQLGVRIEHPQTTIDRWQYGPCAGHPKLPPADYQLVAKSAADSLGDLFSFCMCPGGEVLPSNESFGQVATNGASPSKRGGPFGNAGLVVTIPPILFGNDPIKGIAYQDRWERLAFKQTGETYRVPAQRASDFLADRPSNGVLETSYPLGGKWIDLRRILPDVVTNALMRGLPMLDQRMKGFTGPEGIIVGPETRASAPFRIIRNATTRQSANTANLYPAGEGAGYAGGIVSSAIDGMRTARTIIRRFAPFVG